MFSYGMPIANFYGAGQELFSAGQELIGQSIDLAHLIGRDILPIQSSQLVLCWLVVVTIVNWP
jgi:hypothetical protein